MPKTTHLKRESFQLSPIKAMELAASRIPGVVSLAQGIPSFNTPTVITDYVIEQIRAGHCDKYSLTTGLPELREEIALSLQQDGLAYDPESEIIVTVGSIEAITATLLGCTSHGSEVIIPSPTYASYSAAIRLAGCVPKFAELDEERNFDLDINKIKAALTKKTRAIFYCNPNNPTGTIFSRQQSEKLLELAIENDLIIITDEVYKDFYFTDVPHFTPAQLPEGRERVVRVFSFSKAYAMTGWRAGYLHTDAKLAQSILKYHDSMVTCAPLTAQYAALAALRHAKDLIPYFREEYRKRRDLTISYLDKMSHALDYQIPQAAYFVFPRIKDTVPMARDSNKLAYDILEKSHVALVPGIAFGPSGESHLRISFGRSENDLIEGLDRLSGYFSKHERKMSLIPSSGPAPTLPQSRIPLRRKIAQQLLAPAARYYLKRNHPVVIGIAGIRGKTVFKRTVIELLSKYKKTRSNLFSYNTEIGFPLSILNLKVPSSTLQKILFPFVLLKRALIDREATEILVLEYGIRSLADAESLSEIALPDWLLLSPVSSQDVSLDYHQIRAGLERLTGSLKKERIIWCKGDPFLVELSSKFNSQLAIEAQALINGVLNLNGDSYPVSRPLPGESYHDSAVGAVMLALELGVPKDLIASFLAPTAQAIKG